MKKEYKNYGDLYHGDCIKLMKDIPDGSVDMVLCDLPYGVTGIKWDTPLNLDELWKEYNRITKENAAVVLFGAQPFTSLLVMSNSSNFKYEWIWEKTRPSLFQHAKRMPMRKHENILVFYKKQPTYNQELIKLEKPTVRKNNNKNGSHITSIKKDVTYTTSYTGYNNTIITYSNHNVNKERKRHPTEKPVELFEFLIKTYTNENETVLDNTCGAGTTAIASIKTNRKFIVMEKEEQYIDICKYRINKIISQKEKELF